MNHRKIALCPGRSWAAILTQASFAAAVAAGCQTAATMPSNGAASAEAVDEQDLDPDAAGQGSEAGVTDPSGGGAPTEGTGVSSLGAATWDAEPLDIDQETAFGVSALSLVDLVVGRYSGVLPAGLDSSEFELSLARNDRPLALEHRTYQRPVPQDHDQDGIDDGSVRVAIPVRVQVVADLGLNAMSAEAVVYVYAAQTARLDLTIDFAGLSPPFDPANLDDDAAGCGLGVVAVRWSEGPRVQLELLIRSVADGRACKVLNADLTKVT